MIDASALRAASLDGAIGLAIGFLGGLFGISGGIMAIPVLGLLGASQQIAQGTSLVMQLPTTLIGLAHYTRRGKLERHMLAILALCALPSSFVGGLVAVRVASSTLREAFASFIGLIATYSLWSVLRRNPGALTSWRFTPAAGALIGLIGGFLSGVFGIGGAAFAIPTLTLVFGLPQTAAQGMALALIAPPIAMNLIVYGLHGLTDWRSGVPMAIGGIISVSWGVALAYKIPQRVLRYAFCVLLYAGAIALWFKT